MRTHSHGLAHAHNIFACAHCVLQMLATGTTLHLLASLLMRRGQHEEALQLGAKSLRLLRAKSSKHASTATALNNLGVMHKRAGLHGEAEAYYRCARCHVATDRTGRMAHETTSRARCGHR